MKSYRLYTTGGAPITTIDAHCINSAVADATSVIEHTEAELDYRVDVANDTAQNGKYFIERIRDDERGGS